MSQTPFQARLSEAADLTEARLTECLAGAHGSVAGAPTRLLAAMRHGALGGG